MRRITKFFLISLVALLSLGALLPNFSIAANEDFTTYTETDPNSDITITSTRVTWDTMRNDAIASVGKSYGAGHFGDFTHNVDVLRNSTTAGGTRAVFWGLSDGCATLTDCDTANSGIALYWSDSYGVGIINLTDFTNNNADSTTTVSSNTVYYLTISRSGTTVTVSIYLDSARTNLTDTLTITSGSNTYQYVFALMSYDTASYGGSTHTGYSENLNLNEPAAATSESSGDHSPPRIISSRPAGTLPDNTTQTKITLETDEAAVCRYSTNRFTSYDSMTGNFSADGSILNLFSYSFSLTALKAGNTYNYYVKCSDTKGNITPDDFLISFNMASDIAPPLISKGEPSGFLGAGTTQTNLAVATNEPAVCRYSATSTIYSLMENTFLTSDETSHFASIAGLKDGNTYTYHVKCSDNYGNVSTDDYIILFSIARPQTLDVALIADPSSGQAPLMGVYLAATVSGTATGTINYTFYCNRSDLGTNITPGYLVYYHSIGLQYQKTSQNECNYLSPGVYHPKVIIERGKNIAQAVAEVTVREKEIIQKVIEDQPIINLTVKEIENKIIELQQKIIELIKQLIALLQSELAGQGS